MFNGVDGHLRGFKCVSRHCGKLEICGSLNLSELKDFLSYFKVYLRDNVHFAINR